MDEMFHPGPGFDRLKSVVDAEAHKNRQTVAKGAWQAHISPEATADQVAELFKTPPPAYKSPKKMGAKKTWKGVDNG